MGAYSNPETYIDTQSAQSLQKLQDTISGSFAKVANSYAENQKEIRVKLNENVKKLKANHQKGQEISFELYGSVAKANLVDPSLKLSETYKPLIDRAVVIKTGMLNGTLVDEQASAKEYAEIIASVGGLTGMLSTMSGIGTTYLEGISRGVKVEGGSASSNSPRIDEAMGILTQKLNGTKNFYYKDNNPLKLMLAIKNDQGELVQEFDADQIKKLSEGEGLYRIVPNQTAEFDKLKSINSTIFETKPNKPGEKGDPIPTGQVNPDFLIKDANGKIVVEQSEVINTNKFKQITFNQKVNIEAIKADRNFNATINAQAEGLLKSNQSGAIDFYNDIMSEPRGRWKGTGFSFEPNKPLDNEGKKKFIEDYKEYYINTQITPTQALLKPDSDTMTLIEKDEKPKKTKADKKDKKESIESIAKRIGDTKLGDIADFTYGGRKVAYDGVNFTVEKTSGLKDLVFTTKKDVINYLKQGSTSKPKP